jgi:tRNA1(Val) A37 N6-methylase TrmN6
VPTRVIIDERTLAAWLGTPTALRANRLRLAGEAVLIEHADVEEHVLDPSTGSVKRCDVTMRSTTTALLSAELKRPEVAAYNHPGLLRDAWAKAVGRGLHYYATCDMRTVALWRTSAGPVQMTPVEKVDLAPGLMHSSAARQARVEIETNWALFLDLVEQRLQQVTPAGGHQQAPLPGHAQELRDAILAAAEEAATRIQANCADQAFRQRVVATFSDQFGVEMLLDPVGSPQRLAEECHQVATIACFVVATRLLLYQALATGAAGEPPRFTLNPLAVPPTLTDAGIVRATFAGYLAHAQSETQDFELQLRPTALDEIAFVPVPAAQAGPVGQVWDEIVQVVGRSDWTAPARYVPGLYESLLDDEHRHIMGVHYTPDAVAEIVTAYAVREPTDVVLDPAAGAGTFVTMAYQRKRALGCTHEEALAETYGVEIADFAASLTGLGLALADSQAASAYPRVVKSDFFLTRPGAPTDLVLPGLGTIAMPEALDAIIGNPPYVRFEERSPAERLELEHLLRAAHARGVADYPNFTGKADLWAFFVAHAFSFLKPGGRLAFVLSWSLLSTTYGDAVLSFLARYFTVDAVIDSKVERFFAAKQNTVLLLARRAPASPDSCSPAPNPTIPADHPVRFVRLKQPLEQLLTSTAPRGQQAEDLVDDLLGASSDVADDVRWDVRVIPYHQLTHRAAPPPQTAAGASSTDPVEWAATDDDGQDL